MDFDSAVSSLLVAESRYQASVEEVRDRQALTRTVQIKSASRIDRLNRQREVRLRASVAPVYGMADRLACCLP